MNFAVFKVEMMKNTSSADIDNFIKNLKSRNMDILVKTVSYFDGHAHLCYIGQLVDRNALSELVIKPLLQYCSEKKRKLSAEHAESLLYADQIFLSDDINAAEKSILDGLAVILFSNDAQYIVVNCRKVESRPVAVPELTYSYRGPRDSFVENLDKNLSLLRYRLKDGNIRIEKKEVGVRTKSTVAVVYLNDIANPAIVKEINKRIDGIKTDGVYESGELQNYLFSKKTSLFPQMGIVERSDMAVELLLEGKVVIFIDGSGIALSAPKVFPEFMYSCDDRYDNKYFGMFMRIIRYLAVAITLTSTSYYIAVAEFHPDAMPASYIVTFAQMRSRAPFSAFIAVLSLEFIVELMREALLRVPVKIGSAIAIVGAIIIGQAATTSGFYSPLLLILVSIGFLCSFAIPDLTLANPLRMIKFIIIILTGFFGFFGFSLAMTFILMLVVSNDSFGIPYMAPWAPYKEYDFKRSFIFSRRTSSKRQGYMRNNDDTRAPGTDRK